MEYVYENQNYLNMREHAYEKLSFSARINNYVISGHKEKKM